ncbi:MAG TPA: ABC transporter ATP-binding protein [Chloroflexota bacterium]|nr:ABC transporter ATP-binding protein [Chloroflexota bacterium]HUM67255.1 ABC transporter ATP-binding protein [Chloroflexota bacterium]
MNKVLELQNVSKIYGSGHTAVTASDHVNLQVKPGEIVLIMGPSGSGKTTVLSMAGLLLRPTEGKVLVNGRDITGLSQRQMAALRLRSLGFVFQAYNLLGALTARENVAVVMNLAGVKGRAASKRAAELLAMLGLEHRLDHKPADLSGGEKQRVAIARALANDPPLILADEPTGNLDSQTGREVMELLCCGLGRDQASPERGRRGRAIVIVTHDHRLQQIADRVLWLEDGRLGDRPDSAHANRHFYSLDIRHSALAANSSPAL